MESFSLVLASGWQNLGTLLAADATFSGRYLWSNLSIKNTHATATMIIKRQSTSPAGGDASGINLAVGATTPPMDSTGMLIDGRMIWLKCSATGSCDVMFIQRS